MHAMKLFGVGLVLLAGLALPVAAERRDPSKVRIVQEVPSPPPAGVRPASVTGRIALQFDPRLGDVACSSLDMELGIWVPGSQPSSWAFHRVAFAPVTGIASSGTCRYTMSGIRPRTEPYSIYPNYHPSVQAVQACNPMQVAWEPGSVQISETGQTARHDMVVKLTCLKESLVAPQSPRKDR